MSSRPLQNDNTWLRRLRRATTVFIRTVYSIVDSETTRRLGMTQQAAFVHERVEPSNFINHTSGLSVVP